MSGGEGKRWSWGYPDGVPGTPEYEPAPRICNWCRTVASRCNCDDGDTRAPNPPAAASEVVREAIEQAARYVLENSRRGNAGLNDEQFAADTDALMTAYCDIIGKAVASGCLASLSPTQPEVEHLCNACHRPYPSEPAPDFLMSCATCGGVCDDDWPPRTPTATHNAEAEIERIAESTWVGETQLKTDYPPRIAFADEPDRERFLWLARYVAALTPSLATHNAEALREALDLLEAAQSYVSHFAEKTTCAPSKADAEYLDREIDATLPRARSALDSAEVK